MPNNNFLAAVLEATGKIADFAGMSADQKKEYQDNISRGLALNLLADGTGLTPEENLEKLDQYFQEIGKTEAGRKIFAVRLGEIMKKLIMPAVKRLTQEQAGEVMRTLGTETLKT